MTDFRLKQNFNPFEPSMDFWLRSDGSLDEREELATAVRVALGTDKLADENVVLPDPDSTDRRGWWGDMEAESIWDGWPIGTKAWLLTRAKITQAQSEEGDTLERARIYTLEALQPLIDRGVASEVTVNAVRSELHRIDVHATIYRGPLPEIDLSYQLLWENAEAATDFKVVEALESLRNDLTVSAPILGYPLLATHYSFNAVLLIASSPVLDRPVYRQRRVLSPANFAVPAPVITVPSSFATNGNILFASNLVATSPVLGRPVCAAHVLTGASKAVSSPALTAPTIEEGFSVQELFGVDHPDQLLTIHKSFNPASQKLLKNSIEVPYQVVDDNILVRATDGVAGNSSHFWKVASGAMSASPQVTVTDYTTYYEIDNGIVAFRTPKTITVGSPVWPDAPTGRTRIWAPDQVLGPIQGIRHRDGTWTGTGPNYLYHGATWTTEGPPHNEWINNIRVNYPATSASVSVLESGPLRAKIKISYIGLRPALGANLPYSDTGYFDCTITLEAGQHCFIVEQESDGRPTWYVNMNTGVTVDRARYRGQAASSIAQGHNYDGTLYPPIHERASTDAEVNISEAGLRNNYDWTGWVTPFDGVHYKRLWAWYTWDYDSGWYWHAYNSAGGSSSNMWGIFQGAASLYHGAIFGQEQAGFYGTPASGALTEFGFWAYVSHSDQNPPLTDLDRKQLFGIFLGRKGDDVPVDFSAWYYPGITDGSYSTYPPGIAKAFNLHSGAGQFYKQIDQGLYYPDPVGGFSGMYLVREDIENLIADLEADQGSGSLYEFLCSHDSGYVGLWNAFADVTNEDANTLLEWCLDMIQLCINVYVNIGEIHSLWWSYWTGATKFQSIAVRVAALISLDQYRPFLTMQQKEQLKSALSMIGHLMHDNDFVPADNYETFYFGTANMPIQYVEGRNQITVLLKDHPQFAARFDDVYALVTAALTNALDSYGTPKDCPHYAGALVVPTTDVLRQLQVAEYEDVFADTSAYYARLVVLSEWCMQVMSPKQSRFGNRRKVFAFGDGAHEGSDLFLSMIMGFENSNLTLAKRMAGAWADMDWPMSSFYASSGLKIRPDFPTQDPALGDADFPGYMTVMRSGWNTANESAVILPHGNSLVDHSNFQRGSPSIYLLGAPVCVSFGSMYSPQIRGPWVSCSTYIANNQLGWVGDQHLDTHTWDTATDLNFPCGIYSDYITDTYDYSPDTNRVDLTLTFSAIYNWVRQITYYRDVVSCPVVRLRDDNTETGDSIFTLHMMATGAVTKESGGTVTPTSLTDTPFAVANGDRFQFVGQWGISWDVYYFGPSAQAFIGVYSHTWAGNREANEYYEATGNNFEEKQYILRIKTAGPCDVVIVPYHTGQRPGGLDVVQVSGGLQINPGSRFLAD